MNVLASTTKLPPIAERVAAGAAVLDGAAPGWATGLDPRQLQVHPLAASISLAKHLRDRYAVELTHKISHGVCLSLADFDNPDHDPRPVLLDAWRTEVTRRQQPIAGGGDR